MKKNILLLLLLPQILYAQAFECDNSFETCGTPEQSGGGGGGGGSVLINNTDLGDTYQNADDFDDDGIEDNVDNCPRIRNRDQSNSDGDSWGDACDNCLSVSNSYQLNVDGDKYGDECDNDIDNDGFLNYLDNCVNEYNINQSDLDNDSLGDVCDPDIDNDNLLNQSDECPLILNHSVECNKDFDQDGILDYYTDDLFEDNCVAVYNPEQVDTDADGKGDVCDSDDDNDSILDNLDNCVENGNYSQIDSDKDGIGDECDPLFCYVVFNNEKECLDPSLNLQVYSPSLLGSVNQNIKIRIFINRENQKFKYTLSILEKPDNSTLDISKFEDEIEESFNFEYKNDLIFKTNQPGEYKIRLEIESLGVDLITSEINNSILYDFRIVIEGQSNNNINSCDASKNDKYSLLLLIFFVFAFINLRKSI